MNEPRYIDATSAIIVLSTLEHEDDSYAEYCRWAKGLIRNLPTCDVQHIRTGAWRKTGTTNVFGGVELQCTNCEKTVMVSPEHFENWKKHEAFCCHCGAKMIGIMGV